MPTGVQQRPGGVPEGLRSAGAVLLRSLAGELVTRTAGRAPGAFPDYDTRGLLELARGALAVAAGEAVSAGTCLYDGYELQLTTNGWCCVDGHCL